MTATGVHVQLDKRFTELSERCHEQINADAKGSLPEGHKPKSK